MINPRWYNKRLFEQDQVFAQCYVKRQGFCFCFDSFEIETAKQTISTACNVFRKEIVESPLCLLYLYDMDNLTQKNKSPDGFSSTATMDNGKQIASIGISLQALHAGSEYAVMIFLHELTHILYNGRVASDHGKEFHVFLDSLIERYNRETGAHIVNDYYGLDTNS